MKCLFGHEWRYYGPAGGKFSQFQCKVCGKIMTKFDDDH